jgi:uncharacterized protein
VKVLHLFGCENVMSILFQIETTNVSLNWHLPANYPKRLSVEGDPGTLIIKLKNSQSTLTHVHRSEVPDGLASEQSIARGPRLYEQCEYRIVLRGLSGHSVRLSHRDPNICAGLSEEDDGSFIFGAINFRADVGYSSFTVLVNGAPELEFQVEVFPSKLDYKSDYEQLVAETQDYINGLVFEYLRSTYQLSFPNLPKQSGTVEWLLILRSIIGDLERALQFISRRPLRNLVSETGNLRSERVKKVDSFIRTSVQRGAGSGAFVTIDSDIHVKNKIAARVTGHTINTPEHQWMAVQLRRIKDRLVILRNTELSRSKSERRNTIVFELNILEERILRLQKLEPITESEGHPPANFASLQLLTAPGYREIYKACIVLNLGLQIEGGPVDLSLKDLNVLYEYWCFLTVVHMVAKLVGRDVPVKSFVRAKQGGLEILLSRETECRVPFDLDDERSIEVSYNPNIREEVMLTPQRPDIFITFKNAGWPRFHVLLDAKYRVNSDSDYLKRFVCPGPPIDAVNSMHRYRDAILESADNSEIPKRTVVQAAALFPHREKVDGAYRQSKLWESLSRLGIGAIPLLPQGKAYLEEWLTGVLHRGGWATADRLISYSTSDRLEYWRKAASEPVLVGVLRSDNSDEHLKWILRENFYYTPFYRTQPRQLSAKWLALYSPASIRNPGAITHMFQIDNIELLQRSDVSTPWKSKNRTNGQIIGYKLSHMCELKRPIENLNEYGQGRRFSAPRWASRLSLERARSLPELYLESEAEWRLYEELKSLPLEFKLRPMEVKDLSLEEATWRTWFYMPNGTRIRYAGMSGYLHQSLDSEPEMHANLSDLIKNIT